MLKITGICRTDKCFLDRIQKMSKDDGTKEIMERLRKLKIFSIITETEDGLSVTEEKRSVRFSGDTTRRVPRGHLKLKLPNLFGKAENLELSLSTSRDMSARLTKPILCGTLSFLSIFGTKDAMKSPHEEYSHVRASLEMEGEDIKMCVGRERIGSLDQSFLEVRKKLSIFDLRAKVGVFDSVPCRMFLKTQLGALLSRTFSKNLFADLSLSTGMIVGEPHIAERYYLGENIRGYRDMSISPTSSGLKIGGNTFVEMTQRIGLSVWGARGFVFGSLGHVSEDKNIVDSLGSVVRSHSYKDNECLGASVGVGANVPIMRSKDGPVVNVSFSIPLTNNVQVQRLQFGFDMDF